MWQKGDIMEVLLPIYQFSEKYMDLVFWQIIFHTSARWPKTRAILIKYSTFRPNEFNSNRNKTDGIYTNTICTSLHLCIKQQMRCRRKDRCRMKEMLQKIRFRLIIIPVKAKNCIKKPQSVQNRKDLPCS